MKAITLLFEVEKDTKNTRRYQEKATDGPPVVGTLYVQQWALRKLGQGDLPDRLQVTISIPESEGTMEVA